MIESRRPATPIHHYVAEASYYSAKTRAYLRQKRLDFVERFAGHPHYLTEVLPKAGFIRMPTVELPDGTVIQDSSEIIDHLESRYPERPVLPAGPRQRLAALILEVYADEGLLPAGLHYRWSFRETNDPFVIDEFGTAASGGRAALVSSLGEQIASQMNAHLAPMGVTAATIPAIEASTMELFDLLNAHFRIEPYLFGGRASIADCALMAPMYGHFARDPYPAQLMRRRAPRLHRWTERMNAREFPPPEFPDAEDVFAAGDTIPDTTMQVLRLVADDFFPELRGLLATYNTWAAGMSETAPGTSIRSLPNGMAGCGWHTFTLRGVPVSRAARIDTVWKWQRPLEHYWSLAGEDRGAADGLIEALGASDLFALAPVPRIARDARNFFVFGSAR